MAARNTGDIYQTPITLRQSPVRAFRATCDNCAKSKVRCGKEVPSCQRCIYQGVRCMYSPSQRSKKRRAVSDGEQTEEQARRSPSVGSAAAAAAAAAAAEPAERCIATPKPQSDAGNASPVITPSTKDESTTVPQLFNFETTSGFFSPLSLLDAGYGNRTGIHMPVHPSDIESRVDSIFDHDMDAPWVHNGDSKDPITLEESDLATLSSTPDEELMGMFASDQGAGSDSTTDCGTGGRKAHQACATVAFSTLQRLDVPGASCAAPQSDPTGPASSLRRSLDTVLTVNQAAMTNLQAMLNCTCATTTNQALLATAIISQILSWYEAGLQRSYNSGPGGLANVNGGTTGSTAYDDGPSGRPPLRAGTSVFVPPITIGGLQLQGEHGGRVVTQVILVEVIKMDKVVKLFGEKFCSSTQDGGTHLHFALKTFLQNRLRKIMLAAREWLDKT